MGDRLYCFRPNLTARPTQSLALSRIDIQYRSLPSKKVAHTRFVECRVPELIAVLGSQPAGDVSHKPGGRLSLLSARPAVTLAPLRGRLPISLLGEQRHDRCEQFA